MGLNEMEEYSFLRVLSIPNIMGRRKSMSGVCYVITVKFN